MTDNNGGKPPGAQVTGLKSEDVKGGDTEQEQERIRELMRQSPPAATDTPQSAAQMAQQFLNSFVYQVLICCVRGAVVSLQQFHAQAVILTFCRMMAQVVGESFQGNLADVLNARRQCREAFLDQLTKAPVPAPPTESPPMGMTAPTRSN